MAMTNIETASKKLTYDDTPNEERTQTSLPQIEAIVDDETTDNKLNKIGGRALVTIKNNELYALPFDFTDGFQSIFPAGFVTESGSDEADSGRHSIATRRPGLAKTFEGAQQLVDELPEQSPYRKHAIGALAMYEMFTEHDATKAQGLADKLDANATKLDVLNKIEVNAVIPTEALIEDIRKTASSIREAEDISPVAVRVLHDAGEILHDPELIAYSEQVKNDKYSDEHAPTKVAA